MTVRVPSIALWLGLVGSGCSSQDFVLFEDRGTVGSGGQDAAVPAQTGGAAPGERCTSDADCLPGFCQKPTCEATEGTCENRPLICPPPNEPKPVCDCDGVQYWNECFWKRTATGAMLSLDICPRQRPCSRPEDCGVAAWCALLGNGPEYCFPTTSGGEPFPQRGTCWVLPPRCEPELDPQQWIPCPPPGAPALPPAPGTCTDTCTAIQSRKPYYRENLDECT